MPKSMAVPTIVLFASATVTLVGVGPIKGILVQRGLWSPADVRAHLTRPIEVPVAVSAPSRTVAPEQSAAPARGLSPKKKAPAMDVFQVPAGTPLLVVMRTPVSSGNSQMDEEIRATLRSAVTQDGVELVPSGSVMHGKVVEVVPASPSQRRGLISLAFYVIEHAETGSRAPIVTRVLPIQAVAPDPAVVGKSAAKRPVDAQVSAGDPLTFTLAEPLIVRIPK